MDTCYRDKVLVAERPWLPVRPVRWEQHRRKRDLYEQWSVEEPSLLDEGCVAVVVEVDQAPLAERFRAQADKWARETRHLSSPSQMMAHPSYQAILGMAQDNRQEIVRLLLLDLQRNRTKWFWALSYLTQDNPIAPSDAGKIDKMISAWVGWGREHDYI